jgi:hypothetical protein
MAYRSLTASVAVADDSNLQNLETQRSIVCNQTKDLQTFNQTFRVATNAAQSANIISGITQGYFIWISSDYPIKVSINATAAAATFTLNSNNVAATNVGAPLPDQCVFLFTGQVTSLYLTPISGAAQTANVRVVVSGDPVSAYV